jgi:hypothetical protein
MSSATATASGAKPHSGWLPAATAVSVLVIATTVTWAFFSMRSVMDVGGSCADGGPYVSSQPCPDASWLLPVAIPVMLLTAIFGSMAAISVNAPNLLILMWALLFGSLGWNFLEYAFIGPDVVWGWLICGVMFWLMAAPAVFLMLVALKNAVVPPREKRSAGSRWWVPAYSGLTALGFLVGAWSYHAIS